MKLAYSQQGWTKLGVIGVMVSAVIGAFVFEMLLQLIPSSVSITAPWAIVPLFMVPLTLCIQSVFKLWDLLKEEQDKLSKTERRRLKSTIKGKTRQFYIAIVFYVFSAFVAVISFVFFASNAELFRIAIKITGVFLGVSMFTIFLIVLEMQEISEYKTKLTERAAAKIRQNAALKRLKIQPDNDVEIKNTHRSAIDLGANLK